jgi:hypothetical protein
MPLNPDTQLIMCRAGITSLGFDHMELLGDTLDKIAAEKAGIMRRDVPCITVQQPEEAMAALRVCVCVCVLFVCVYVSFCVYVCVAFLPTQHTKCVCCQLSAHQTTPHHNTTQDTVFYCPNCCRMQQLRQGHS